MTMALGTVASAFSAVPSGVKAVNLARGTARVPSRWVKLGYIASGSWGYDKGLTGVQWDFMGFHGILWDSNGDIVACDGGNVGI